MATIAFTREHAATYRDRMIAALLGLSLDTAGRITDLNDGSNTKDLLEAVGVALERLDAKAFAALRRAIPEAMFESFGNGDGVTTFVGFPALPAIAASGIVRLQRRPEIGGDLEVPAGAQLWVPGIGAVQDKVYATLVPATLRSGEQFVDTIASCTVTGLRGNTAANTMQLRSVGADDVVAQGIMSATNPQAFQSGAAAETDAARFVRWRAFIRNLSGAQIEGLEVGALQAQVVVDGVVTERVLAARAVRVPDKRGLVDVFIDNGGGGASPTLVTEAQAIVDGRFAADGTRVRGYKAAGETVRVTAVASQIIDVACTITPERGFTFGELQAPVTTVIAAHLFGLGVFTDLILAELIEVVSRFRGVADVVFTAPAANVSTESGKRIVAGVITVEPPR